MNNLNAYVARLTEIADLIDYRLSNDTATPRGLDAWCDDMSALLNEGREIADDKIARIAGQAQDMVSAYFAAKIVANRIHDGGQTRFENMIDAAESELAAFRAALEVHANPEALSRILAERAALQERLRIR